MNKHATVIISKNRGNHQSDAAIENELAELCFQQSGLSVLIIPHLYDLPDDSDVWDAICKVNGRLLLATWIYPRPAEIIFAGHGITLESDSVLDLKAYTTASECHQAVLEKLSSDDKPSSSEASIQGIHEDVCERWYPVIDSTLCANCGNCLQFCIFNVYTYDESHRVTATNPDNCKTGCPACSRICPEGAIIFPLYNKDAAISGAPGLQMSPDAAARKMFYMRTKKQCPVCNQVSDDSRTRNQNAATRICDECGSPIDIQPETGYQQNQDSINDIDLLIDDLEKITKRRS